MFKRLCSYLFVLFIFFFALGIDASASSYYYDYSGCPKYGETDVCHIYLDGTVDAYCIEKWNTLPQSGETTCTEWTDDKFSSYVSSISGNKGTKSGYRGEILARIVLSAKNYYDAQVAIWNYLAGGLPEYNVNIKNAYENYDGARNITVQPSDLITVTEEDSSKKFYYMPDSDCPSVSNKYKTKKITIKSNQSRRVTIDVKAPSGGKFIYNNKEYTSKSIDLIPNNRTAVIYLVVNTNDDYSGDVVIDASMVVKETRNIEVPYFLFCDAPQNLIGYMQKKSVPDEVTTTYKQKFTSRYTVDRIVHKTCDDYPNSESNKENTYPAGEQVSKKCVNSLFKPGEKKTPPKKELYEANYANCNCMTLDLDGKKVKIRLYENTSFRFGILNPVLVYPGGGVRFAKEGESITTDYISKVTWRYVDFHTDGTPYFYNENDIADNRVSNELHNVINSKIESLLDDKLDLNFKTVDSNTGNNTTVTISNKLQLSKENQNVDGRDYVVVTAETAKEGISMNHAWFSTGGNVKYGKIDSTHPIDSTHLIDGGNKYYVPLDFKENKFHFDIPDDTNLSVLKNKLYEFKYGAFCEVEVSRDPDKPNNPCKDSSCDNDTDFLSAAIAYRSIDLSNPFPRANTTTGEGMKENWKEWYTGSGSASNKARIRDTYKDYPNNPLYSVSIDDDKLKKIASIKNNKGYNDWSTVDKNGYNDFVTEFGVTTKSSNSYCKISEFIKEECDK